MKEILRGFVFLVVLVGALYIQREFFPLYREIETISIDTLYIQRDSIVYRNKLIPYAVSLPSDTVKIPSDTVELVRRYLELHKTFYTKNYYRDTTVIDSVGNIYVSFRVTENRADSLSIEYSLIQNKIINQTIVNSKNSLYLGGFIGKDNLSPTIMYSRNNNYSYFVSYNLLHGGVSGGVLINVNEIKKLW